jgi:hypothetical protein
MGTFKQVSQTLHGRDKLSLQNPRAFLPDWVQDADDEIVGDADPDGTLLFHVEVPQDKVLHVYNLTLTNKVNPTSFVVAQNNDDWDPSAAGWGHNAEWQLLDTFLLGSVETLSINSERVPLYVVRNTESTVDPATWAAGHSLHLLVLAPEESAGAAGNNAATEYWGGRVAGVLEDA